MTNGAYRGVLLIGDPHLEGRQPGFRKDDYPNVILEKLAWCLDYARNQCLLPAVLGDLFQFARDNPTWMLGRLLELLQGEIVGVYGNHDCADPALSPHDSLSLLVKAGRLRLIEPADPWRGVMNGRRVVIGGSSYRQALPKEFNRSTGDGVPPLVLWLTHHDILIPGYDEGRIKPYEIPGVDLLINGHIHRRLAEACCGSTRWLTPGNISRRKRDDATRDHVPAVLRIDVSQAGYDLQYVIVPHRPFDEVFHDCVVDVPIETSRSAFVRGLAELQARRTASGAGLAEFLRHNVGQFESPVAEEIMRLAQEVLSDGSQ